MYFHTDSTSAREFIENVARLATEHEQRLRIDVDSEGNLRIKRGEGMWSAPIMSTPDPYRDMSINQRPAAIRKWFVNEDGEPYEYPLISQGEDFPNDFHTPFDTYGEAADWARRYRRRMNR